jgi:hypothetical protein
MVTFILKKEGFDVCLVTVWLDVHSGQQADPKTSTGN